MAEDENVPFKKGDAVQHKTGGPKMIYVGEAAMTGGAICNWMANGRKQSEIFDFEELELYQQGSMSSTVTRG